jgi:TonB family protein
MVLSSRFTHPRAEEAAMRKLVLVVLSLVVAGCVAPQYGTLLPTPPFEEGWRFLDGVAAAPGDKVDPPVLQSRPNAVYPIEARKQRLMGEVGLEVTVDDAGQILKVEVVSPLEPTMDEAAVTAARKSIYVPARLNGVPKASVVRTAVRFAVH